MQYKKIIGAISLCSALFLSGCHSSDSQQQVLPTYGDAISLSADEKTSVSFDAPFSADSYWLTHDELPDGWNISTAQQSSAHFVLELGPSDRDTVIALELHQKHASTNEEQKTQIRLKVTAVDEKPIALGESFSLVKGQTITHPDLPEADTGNLLLNDRDEPEHTAPSEALTTSLFTPPQHAEHFELGKRGGWSYSAAASSEASTDSFSYVVHDASQDSKVVTVHIALAQQDDNSAPVVSDACHLILQPEHSYDGSLSLQVSDSDDSVHQYKVTENPQHGSLQLDLNTGDFRYAPNTTERGYLDSFSYTVSDLRGGSATGHFSMVVGARRIMPLGDSITRGVESTSGETGDLPPQDSSIGYRKRLKDLLQEAGYAVDFVGPLRAGFNAGLEDAEHAGFSGWKAGELAIGRTTDTSAGKVKDWLSAHPADLMLIHAGTNDYTANSAVLSPLLDEIQTWSTENNAPLHMLISNLIPQRKDKTDRGYLPAFNTGVEALVPSYSPSAVFVDQYSALDWQTDITGYEIGITGLHPNSQGYEKMADRWFESLEHSQLLHKCP